MIDYNQIRFWWSGHSGWKTDGTNLSLVDKIYDNSGNETDPTFASNKPSFNVDFLTRKAYLRTGRETTNLFQRSEEFDNAYWDTSTTITANNRIAPDGTLTADLSTADGVNENIGRLVDTGTPIASKSFTASVYVYSLVTRQITIRMRGNGVTNEAENISVNVVANQWTRVSATKSFTSSADGNTILVQFYNGIFGSDFVETLWFWGAQLETGSVATSYIKTEGSAGTLPASNAVIPNAIPATGTILLWDNHFYETSGQNNIFEWGDGYLAYEEDTIQLQIGSGSFLQIPAVDYQINAVTKPWFYAVKYDTTNVTVWRGDKEGNLTLALPATAHGGTNVVGDLILNSSARTSLHLNSDILTTDEQLTEAQITSIYNGSLPIFQTRGYKGDNVDRLRQKVADDPLDGGFDTEGETLARQAINYDLYQIYDLPLADFFRRVESDDPNYIFRESLNELYND